MRIVYGWNHFKIKSFNPSDLRISTTEEQKFTIERRQKYFHLFWIPFFGIGKKWVLRKNGELYEMPADFVAHIEQQQVRAGTPWYTFAGPLLIVASLLIYSWYEKAESMREAISWKRSFDNEAANLKSKVAAIRPGDYVWLQDNSSVGTQLLLKTGERNGDKVSFSMITSGLAQYELSHEKIESLFRMKENPEKLEVDIQKLVAAVPSDIKEPGKGTDIRGDGVNYALHEIFQPAGPALFSRGNSMFQEKEIGFDLVNLGTPGILTRITNIYGGYEWETALPQPIRTAQNMDDRTAQLYLKGKLSKPGEIGRFKIQLTVLDTLNNEHRYDVEGANGSRKIIQLY
ncbi:hypothetical protein HHL16_10925 [Pseudoflavitalea sp. G-6-1-2]|uniref:hypothetical protein n=1 Tax=Pseudoflavitalea sp. G-6-1-2 TaxID=2728841 RepID=UPI00146BB601|nr:hypothetical protein [Pseudoflavitalea sp. G-6-1-2]NML21390.1 hypothetical protein [Pseudoflavitalea sp. G-6-1-2]